MKKNPPAWIFGAAAAALLAAGGLISAGVRAADEKKPAAAASAPAGRPALSVTVTQPQRSTLTRRIAANGSVAAWQEASIGAEVSGLRLAEVRVNVGDSVKRGQVLATFAADTVAAELAQLRASMAEAEATLAEAGANAQRARELQASGALSAQQIAQYFTAERTAQARLDAQRAAVKAQQVRLAQARLVAPDDGVISSRSATVGAVPAPGTELFRMIRRGRLEWRAEVAASDLARIKPGQVAIVTTAGGEPVKGVVRMVAPTVDAQSRNGLVYVDLPAPGPAKAGMFARGEFEIGSQPGLTLPQGAVVLREGFAYVLRVGPDLKVVQTKVSLGARSGERVEITGGLDADARVVASGGAFLGDGDLVRIVDAPAPAKTASAK
jgi:RND family efflux transporter MFP subunit